MNLHQEYLRKLVTPEEAVKAVKSGDWVDYTTNVCFPPLLDAALAKRRDELTDVKVRGNLLFGPLQIVECDPTREHFCYNSWHCSAYERKLCDKGLCSYIPMIFRNVVPYYRHFLTVNVAMMCVPPMDQHGYFNLSCATGVARGILDKADIVILEVNEHLPYIYGGFDEAIHISEVDYVVEGPHDPLPEFPVAVPTAEDRAIAELLVPYVRDGAALQLGIGAMPNVVGSLLAQSDVKDLTMHTELCGDAYYQLYEAGKLTGARCALHPRKGFTGIVFGPRPCTTGWTGTRLWRRRRWSTSTLRPPSRSWRTWCPSTAASAPICTDRSAPKAPACATSAAPAASWTISPARRTPRAARPLSA